MTTRIIIADDHGLFRSGLKAIMEERSDLGVVGECETGAETVALCRQLTPHVLIADLHMPGQVSGIEAVRQVLTERPELVVIVVTMHDDPSYLRDMLAAGVKGFVLKDASTDELLRAVEAGLEGRLYVDPKLTPHLVNVYVGGNSAARAAAEDGSAEAILTPREREVCTLIAKGHTNTEMATMLHISKRTIETHRRNLLGKLDLNTRAELVQFAIDQGLLLGSDDSVAG